MALIDSNGRLQHINTALAQLLQCSPQALLGMTLEDLLHPQDRGVCRYAREQARRKQADTPCGEVRLQRGEDDYLWSRLSLCPVSTGDSPISHYLIRVELPRTTQERAEQIYLLSFALDYITDGVLLLDDQLCIRYINEAASRLLGQARQYLLGQAIGQALARHWPRSPGTVTRSCTMSSTGGTRSLWTWSIRSTTAITTSRSSSTGFSMTDETTAWRLFTMSLTSNAWRQPCVRASASSVC
nr:PAS domain-containing protein [Pseudomonas peli]